LCSMILIIVILVGLSTALSPSEANALAAILDQNSWLAASPYKWKEPIQPTLDDEGACGWSDTFLRCNAQGHVISLKFYTTKQFWPKGLPAEINSLTYLTELNFQDNWFGGGKPIPATFAGLERLVTLDLTRVQGLSKAGIAPFLTAPNLQYLWASGLEITSIPSNSKSYKTLVELYLQDNQITGTIPLNLKSNQNLVVLNLRNNKFKDDVSFVPALTSLTRLEISSNQFYGSISGFQNSLKLMTINVSRNALTGAIPGLTGPTTLRIVNFGTNKLTGSLPQTLESLTSVTILDFSNNQLTGTIPSVYGNQLKSIVGISLDRNFLSGAIPRTFGYRPSLKILNLASNQLHGTIPNNIGTPNASLVFLSLARNNLNGTIPPFKSDRLEHVELHRNRLWGPVNFSNYPNLNTLLLFGNQLSIFDDTNPKGCPQLEVYLPLPQEEFCRTGRGVPVKESVNCTIPHSVCVQNECVCDVGRELSSNLTLGCIDINECNRGTSVSLRPINAPFGQTGGCLADRCVNTDGNFACCDEGFEASEPHRNPPPAWNGTAAFTLQFCKDINECARGTSLFLKSENTGRNCSSDKCVNTKGSFVCCREGYEPTFPTLTIPPIYNRTSAFEATYCKDINECENGESQLRKSPITHDICDSTTCINTPGAWQCCPSGFRNSWYPCPGTDWTRVRGIQGRSSQYCHDVNECVEGTYTGKDVKSANTGGPCKSADDCVNANGTFFCCEPGYRNRNLTRLGTNRSCSDINECLEGDFAKNESRSANTNRSCESRETCLNGQGNFFCCDPGYENKNVERLGKSEKDCTDINECLEGTYAKAKSNNTGEPCTSRENCINANGTFLCCPPGFQNRVVEAKADLTKNDLGCTDINECSPETPLATCKRKDLCKNTIGSYTCCQDHETYRADLEDCGPCFGEWVLQPIADRKNDFNSLSEWTGFDFLYCTACEGGSTVTIRTGYSPICQGGTFMVGSCDYACPGLTYATSAKSAVGVLKREFNKGNFLKNVLWVAFKMNITWPTSSKRAEDGVFSIEIPCSEDSTAAIQLIQSLGKEITPNAPAVEVAQVQNGGQCELQVSSQDPNTGFVLALIGGLCGAALILILLGVLAYWYFTDNLRFLPDGVSWPYRSYRSQMLLWDFHGTKSAGYYFRKLPAGEEFYNRAMELFQSVHPDSKNKLVVKDITAVYNPVLVDNFIGNYRIATTRMTDVKVFRKETWRMSVQESVKKAEWVQRQFQKLESSFPWNKEGSAAIVPMLHGTDAMIAEKICETGFAALSSLDAGFFGKGIYFTSFSMYTLPYISSRKIPAIILSWVLPGHVYPVTEDHQGSSVDGSST